MLSGLLVACQSVQGPPCSQDAEPSFELTPSDADFGTHAAGDAWTYAPPPQGGAPYGPVDLRVQGLVMDEPLRIYLEATDLDSGEELGSVMYNNRLVCANVGDSAGSWLGLDVHHRFFGYALEDLSGRAVELMVEVTDIEDTQLRDAFEATLVSWDVEG